MKCKKVRQSNIELLRIMAISGVVFLHYCNTTTGGALSYLKDSSFNRLILYFFLSLFACSVDLFLIISGYFLADAMERSISKPVELVVQVVLFSELTYIVDSVLSNSSITFSIIVSKIIPANYFVILYSVTYILSPYINLLLNNLQEKQRIKFVIVLLCIFSIYPTMVDLFSEVIHVQILGLSSVGLYGSQWGYTIVNFFLMYILGAFINKNKKTALNLKKKKLLLVLFIMIFVTFIWANINDRIGFFNERSAWEYCNPIIISEAIVIFLLFLQLKIKYNIFIDKIAKASFSVYLLHGFFIQKLNIEKYVTGNALVMFLHIIGSVFFIYLISLIIHYIYHMLADPLLKRIWQIIQLPTIKLQ